MCPSSRLSDGCKADPLLPRQVHTLSCEHSTARPYSKKSSILCIYIWNFATGSQEPIAHQWHTSKRESNTTISNTYRRKGCRGRAVHYIQYFFVIRALQNVSGDLGRDDRVAWDTDPDQRTWNTTSRRTDPVRAATQAEGPQASVTEPTKNVVFPIVSVHAPSTSQLLFRW